MPERVDWVLNDLFHIFSALSPPKFRALAPELEGGRKGRTEGGHRRIGIQDEITFDERKRKSARSTGTREESFRCLTVQSVALRGSARMLGLASLGVSLFTYRQERNHHHEAREMELKHHKVMLDIDKKLHDEQMGLNKTALDMDKRRHEESVKLSEDLHQQSARLERSLHQVQLCAALEQHLQDITSDLVVAGKEADRDMWDQRNAQYQTLLLSATVMFAAGMALIVEGELPMDTNTGLIIGYAASVGMAFAFLFVSIILCIRIVVSMSAFMYSLTNHHQTVVTNLVLKAQDVMAELFALQGAEDTAPPERSPPPGPPGMPRFEYKENKEKKKNYKRLLHQLSVKRREINRYLAQQYLNKRLLNKTKYVKKNWAKTWANATWRSPAVGSIVGSNGESKRGAAVPTGMGKISRLGTRGSVPEVGARSKEHPLERQNTRGSLTRSNVRRSTESLRKRDTKEAKELKSSPSDLKTPTLGKNLSFRNNTLSRQDTGLTTTYHDNIPRMTEFEAFWHQNLKLSARLSTLCFYIGTTFLLIAIAFLIFAR
eukprot:525661-Amorphochlora_amoeboformis.AAC.1